MKMKLTKIFSVVTALFIVFSIPSVAIDEMQGAQKLSEISDSYSQNTEDYDSEKGNTSEKYDENENNPENPDNPDNPDEPDYPDNPDEPDEPDEPENPEVNFEELSDDTVVGRMYICTQQVGLGHAWIYIESDINGEMPVGCYTLKPYQGVSMGTFLFSRSDGPGLYYNVEAYCAEKWGLKNQSSLDMNLTKKQLLKVSERIKQWNYWDFYFNCTFFASEIWNCVSSKKFVPLMFPVLTKAQVLVKGGNRDVNMKTVERTDCYKQKGTGANARLELCSDGSLDSKLM